MHAPGDTVGGSEIQRSPVDMVNIPLFTWFYTSKRWFSRRISEPSTVNLGAGDYFAVKKHDFPNPEIHKGRSFSRKALVHPPASAIRVITFTGNFLIISDLIFIFISF